MLAAMLSGTPTKETEMLKARASGKSITESSDLPSASELNFKQVAGANGTLQMVREGSEQDLKGAASVPAEAILSLLGGKKVSEIREELHIKTQHQQTLSEAIFPSTNTTEQTFSNQKLDELVENKVYDILGSIVGEVNKNLKNKEIINQKLTEAITLMKTMQILKNNG